MFYFVGLLMIVSGAIILLGLASRRSGRESEFHEIESQRTASGKGVAKPHVEPTL